MLLLILLTMTGTLVVERAVLTPQPALAQEPGRPTQIGPSAPLPVYVTNTPVLPEGFVAGSHWRFTTWSSPSVITWVGNIRRVSGPWAYIEVSREGTTQKGWYYVPAMPGNWDQQ